MFIKQQNVGLTNLSHDVVVACTPFVLSHYNFLLIIGSLVWAFVKDIVGFKLNAIDLLGEHLLAKT